MGLHQGEGVVGGHREAAGRAAAAEVSESDGAVNRVRLEEESRRRQEWLLASSEVSRRILAADDDGAGVLELIAGSVRRLAGAQWACFVMPGEDDPAVLRVSVVAGPGDSSGLEGATYPRAGSVADEAMRRGRGLVVDADQRTPDGLLGPDAELGPVMGLPVPGAL